MSRKRKAPIKKCILCGTSIQIEKIISDICAGKGPKPDLRKWSIEKEAMEREG